MRDFRETAWEVAGPRPHLLLMWRVHDLFHSPSRQVADQACAGLDPTVVSVLPPAVRHLTLAWVDTPADQLDAELGPHNAYNAHNAASAAADVAGRRRFVELPPYIVIREVRTTDHGVRLVVDPTRELDELADQAVDALRAGYGQDAPIRRADMTNPHVTLAYGRANSALLPPGAVAAVEPAVLSVGELRLLHLDTYAASGPEISPAWPNIYINEGGLYRGHDDDPCRGMPVTRPSRYTPHDSTLVLPADVVKAL